jgi:azurin
MKKPAKHAHGPSFRGKKWTALLGIAILLFISLTIFFVAKSTLRGPGPGQYAGSASNGSPPEVQQQTLPESSVERGTQLVHKGDVPILQQGVKAEEVKKSFEIGTSTDIPAFDKTEITAKAGEIISVRFKNDSNPKLNYLFSWVLTKPGKDGEVILQSDRVGLQQDFIPKTDDVLAASRLLRAGETDTVVFRAPDQPGNYPYISTFPGQGQAMHGILKVE